MVFAMSLKVNATVRDIQRQLSIEARTLPHYLVISDMKQDGFYRFFRPNDPISAIGEYSVMFAYEVTPYKGEFTPSLPHPGSIMGAGGETIFVILQCRVGQGEYSKRYLIIHSLLILAYKSINQDMVNSYIVDIFLCLTMILWYYNYCYLNQVWQSDVFKSMERSNIFSATISCVQTNETIFTRPSQS